MAPPRSTNLLFCLLALAPLLLAQVPAVAAQDAARQIGALILTRGEVTLRDAAGIERPAKSQGAVYEGDVVTVADGGFASLRMVDNAHLSLGSGTEFGFERYRFDGNPATRDSVMLRLERGCFRTTSGIAGSVERDEYRVATPLANIEVDATFHGASLLGERLYTATWDGATVVANAAGKLDLGKYGDFKYSRTLPGEAPKGMRALLPEAACQPPAELDAVAEPYRVNVRDRDRENQNRGRN